MYHLIRPPSRYIWWEYAQERPPNLIIFCQKLQTVTWLFAAFLFFNSFSLNSLSNKRGFRGKLSNFITDLCLCSIAVLEYSKISASLLKFVSASYAPRAPPLPVFCPSKIQKITGGIPYVVQRYKRKS